jgi:hypothetical protein
MSESRIMRSNRSGIQPYGWVDLGTGSLSLSSVDITDCLIDGIDLRGPFACNLVDVVSTVPNGNVGVYLRSGAQAKSAGITTVTGLAGDIDIGAGPALWGTIPATNATELTRITV